MSCPSWQIGNGIEVEAVGLQYKPYLWRLCGVTWDSSRTVVVIKLRRTSALYIRILKKNKWTLWVLEEEISGNGILTIGNLWEMRTHHSAERNGFRWHSFT